MKSSFEGIDFFIDEPNFSRNMWIFKRNLAKYRRKSILPNLMRSILLRLTILGDKIKYYLFFLVFFDEGKSLIFFIPKM